MIYKKIFFLNLVRPAVSMDRLTGRHRTEWSPRGVIGDLNLVIFDPPRGGSKMGGEGGS